MYRSRNPDHRGGDSPTPALDVRDLDPQPTAAGPSLDDLFSQIGGAVAGFAGLYLDSAQVLVVRLTNPDDSSHAIAAVLRVFGGEPGLSGRTVRVEAARHSFGQLRAWRDALMERASGDGIRYVDIDERSNVVRIGVEDAVLVDPVRLSARGIAVPDEALAVEVSAAIRPMTTLGSAVRPVLGGLMITTTQSGCTLGFKAKKTGATRYLVTNAHCTTTVGSVDSTQVGQPLLQSNYWVGYEVADPAFVGGGTCPSGFTCRWADAALVQCDTIAACSQYTVARTTSEYTGSDWTQSGSSTLTADPWFVVGELSSASLVLGAAVSKVGVTSGWTGGTIQQTCVDVYWTSTKLLRCRYSTSAVVRSGDSGAPVFQYEASTGKAWLGGVIWGTAATISYFSPLSGVKSDLGSMTVHSTVY